MFVEAHPVLHVDAAATGGRVGDHGPGEGLHVDLVGSALRAGVCDLDDDAALIGVRLTAARLGAKHWTVLYTLHLETLSTCAQIRVYSLSMHISDAGT